MTNLAQCLVLAVLASLTAPGWGMQNEPADFMGMPWGAPVQDHIAQLKLITENGDSAHYRRPSDRPYFAQVEVRRISYHFYKGNFAGGIVLSVGTRDFNTILSYLKDRYGPPTVERPRHRVYSWEGERVGASISCDISISCYTEIYDLALKAAELQTTGSEAPSDRD